MQHAATGSHSGPRVTVQCPALSAVCLFHTPTPISDFPPTTALRNSCHLCLHLQELDMTDEALPPACAQIGGCGEKAIFVLK